MYFYLYDNEVLMTSSSPFVTDKHKEITREEYDKLAIERGAEPYSEEIIKQGE